MSNEDPTENMRRQMVEAINTLPLETAKELMGDSKEEWDTERLQEDFKVLGFMAPFVIVERKSDGKRGTLSFRHSPRVYFGWKADE